MVDGPVECVDVGKGLMRQVMRLEVVPDHLDVIEFWGIFGQPLDREPVCAGGKRGRRELAGVDRAVILDEYHWLGGFAGPGTIKPIELLEMGDEVATTLGRAGVDDKLARDVIERAQDCYFPGLSWRWHAQIGA